MQKTYSGASEVEKPQSRKTPSVDPIADTRMQCTTWYLSVAAPMHRQPTKAAALTSMRGTVLSIALAPSVRANVGR
jgi:hypothetical protein